MSDFLAGKKYNLIRNNQGKGRRRERNYVLTNRTFEFLRIVPGYCVQHHLFRNVYGGYLECFTDWQLQDYEIKKVA